ncbi:hypothetical protein OAJ79_05535 [Verrucomicrobia bacterium]|jgi:hypothetical protein|nr:hypothetical protein [Verrucomicrobiota bacterium]|tara:strand:- start:54 stop:242 length:189 start_codon:yes stop_codon:yes gene_type:complete
MVPVLAAAEFIIETMVPDDRHRTNSKGFIALKPADKHGIKSGFQHQIAFNKIRIRETNLKDE